ncbi:MAG TPA: hypothetical protein VLT13_11940 [Bacteroidota bacterium]|nr:hypothetical protein [Bacteroidota bacterium]
MKTNVLLLLLVGLLATTGSTCINDGFLVAVNLPIKATFNITAGPNLAFSGSYNVKLVDQIDGSYLENIKNARFYDVRLSTTGTYNGTVYLVGNIDGKQLVTVKNQPWSSFATPQSLIAGSKLMEIDSVGLNQVGKRLAEFKAAPQGTVVVLSANGTLSGQSPVPSGLALVVEILAQVDAEVK